MDVTDVAGERVGYVVDLTEDGMRVRFHLGVDLACLEELLVLLPGWMELGDRLRVAGRFVWCRPFGPGVTEGGFVFESLEEDERWTVEGVIASIARAAAEDTGILRP
jgi:hypothetical protein